MITRPLLEARRTNITVDPAENEALRSWSVAQKITLKTHKRGVQIRGGVDVVRRSQSATNEDPSRPAEISSEDAAAVTAVRQAGTTMATADNMAASATCEESTRRPTLPSEQDELARQPRQ